MKEYDFFCVCSCKTYTSISSPNGCTLGKRKHFLVKRKVFPIGNNALDTMECLSQPINAQNYHNQEIIHDLGHINLRSRSPTETKLHDRSDTMFKYHKILPKYRTP